MLSHSTSRNLSWRYLIPLQQCSNIHVLTVPPLTTSYIYTIYLDNIYPQSLPYSSQSPPTHLPPTVMSYVMVWWVLPICTATTTLPHDPSFPSSHQLLIFLQLVMGTRDPSSIHAGLLTGLISCRPCADSHSRCEILSAATTSYLEDSMLLLSSSSCILSTSSCVMFPSLGWGSI